MGFDAGQLGNSRFLKRADCAKGILLTVTGACQEELEQEGKPAEMHWCLTFAETDKLLVVKPVIGAQIAAALGSTMSDDWTGKRIVLFDDPTVMMGRKIVGGVRARAPKNQQPVTGAARPGVAHPDPDPASTARQFARSAVRPAPAPAPEPEPEFESELPPEDNVPF